MDNNPQTWGTSPADSRKPSHVLRTACWLGIFFIATTSDAASIYRCGNTYSTSDLCANGHAVEINTHTNPHYNALQPTSPAVTELREAEALERKRLASENRVVKQNPPRVIVTSPSAHGLSANTAPTEQTQSMGRGRMPHQYFKAKDPHAPPKKKGNVQTLPPTEK
jgi:hypothetical protein